MIWKGKVEFIREQLGQNCPQPTTQEEEEEEREWENRRRRRRNRGKGGKVEKGEGGGGKVIRINNGGYTNHSHPCRTNSPQTRSLRQLSSRPPSVHTNQNDLVRARSKRRSQGTRL